MLNNAQHAEIKRLLKIALQGNFHEKLHAIEDAARIVGVVTDGRFIHPDMMKAGRKSGNVGNEALVQSAKDAAIQTRHRALTIQRLKK